MITQAPLVDSMPVYNVNVERLPKLGMMIKLSLDDLKQDEKRAVIDHLQAESIEELRGELRFRHWARDGVQIDGEISANLETQCPVSLQPVNQKINAVFNAKFVPATSKLAKPQLNEDGEMILDFDSDDIPDIYEGTELDAWAILLEYCTLEIDPFARAPGAEFDAQNPDDVEDEGEESAPPSPFAVLQSLKK